MSPDEKRRMVVAALGAEIPYRLVTAREVAAIHEEMVSVFGGTPGLRDYDMLESAVGRQLHEATYGVGDLPAIMATLASGVVRNHAFVDGNKRTAFGALLMGLERNGVAIDYDPVEAHALFQELAAGTLSDTDFTAWVRTLVEAEESSRPRESPVY